MTAPNLLETGIYTVSQAAFLVGASQQRVRGWVTGYPRRLAPPVIENELNELGWLDGRLAFSFTNLMEMRFIAVFEDAGVSLAHIRSILTEVKQALAHPHPFATKLVFKTDGKKIVGEIARRKGVSVVYDLRTRNYEMRAVVLRTLKDDVVYDPQGMASGWYPRRKNAPNVILHPKFAFGRPILRDSRIPTAAVAQAVKAEGGIEAVVDWFELPAPQVREAVRFEQLLHRAA